MADIRTLAVMWPDNEVQLTSDTLVTKISYMDKILATKTLKKQI